MLPWVILEGAVGAVGVGGAVTGAVMKVVEKSIDGEMAKNWSYVVKNISNVYNNHFMQNFRTKELALMISRNYTTDTKNISGSIMPENLNDKKIEQIERLIQATLNQTKFR